MVMRGGRVGSGLERGEVSVVIPHAGSVWGARLVVWTDG